MIEEITLRNRHTQLDDLLARICAELQLSPTRYQEAVDRYEAVCSWLGAEGSPVAAYKPAIYPQGSMRIGTTVKPVGREEHDLDFVCEFRVASDQIKAPLPLLYLVADRLKDHGVYRDLLELKNRCIRLNYANRFHLDILPAYPDPLSGQHCILVPDRESSSWKPSNPRGYAEWFEHRCIVTIPRQLMERVLASDAEPIPNQELSQAKAPLKHVVQLLKRWRDLYYQDRSEVAPISMVLTTLAGQFYKGHWSVTESMGDVLTGILGAINLAKLTRIKVLNPANSAEDLSERWEDPKHYSAFVEGVTELREVWMQLTSDQSLEKSVGVLEGLAGQPTKEAFRKQAIDVQAARKSSLLRSGSAGAISVVTGRSIRPNTFHGKA